MANWRRENSWLLFSMELSELNMLPLNPIPWWGIVLLWLFVLIPALLVQFRFITRESCSRSNLSVRLTGSALLAISVFFISLGIADLLFVELASKQIFVIRLSLFGWGIFFLQIGMLCLILGKRALGYLPIRAADQQFQSTTHQTTVIVIITVAIVGTIAFRSWLLWTGFTPVR